VGVGMIIGVLSDTHISDSATKLPKEILEAFKKADMIIHAGDLVNISVLEELQKCCPNVKAVFGNMDPYEVRRLLAEKEIIKVGSHTIGLMHGVGTPGNLQNLLLDTFKNDNVDIIIFGHSHAPCNEIREGVLLFNPGSVTDKIYAKYNSYGIIEITDKIEANIIKI
jgi:putative phosphoesterase